MKKKAPPCLLTCTLPGWSARLDTEFAPHLAAGLVPARVVAQYNDIYRLLTEAGERDASLAGRFRHVTPQKTDRPVTGDWVAAAVPSGDSVVTIRAVLRRLSLLVRGAPGPGQTGGGQALAANVDTLFVLCALDRDLSSLGDFNPRRLERYLALAWESGARPVIVLSKADRCRDVKGFVAAAEAVAPGVPVIAVSALTGKFLKRLKPHLVAGETIALVGSSGVGKSTLVNALADEELQEVGDLRADGRGRHTTVMRELLLMPNGVLLLDTPGLRELRMWEVDEGLDETFPEIEALSGGCRFRDCAHDAEPDCAVRAAAEAGTLDPARLANFLKLRREIRQADVRADALAKAEVARTLRRRAKTVRDEPGENPDRPKP